MVKCREKWQKVAKCIERWQSGAKWGKVPRSAAKCGEVGRNVVKCREPPCRIGRESPQREQGPVVHSSIVKRAVWMPSEKWGEVLQSAPKCHKVPQIAPKCPEVPHSVKLSHT